MCVLGLWHLGTVTAAGLASLGLQVVGADPDNEVVQNLMSGVLPVAEPGLVELTKTNVDEGRLAFTSDVVAAVASSEVIWITFDTPVNDDDEADVEAVVRETRSIFPALRDGAVVIVSSQMPVGSVRRLQEEFSVAVPDRHVEFLCIPENLRLGQAVDRFLHPDRLIVGVPSEAARVKVAVLLEPLFTEIVFMGVESAEVTKHAINAFLATSVAFANEIAAVCALSGATPSEVELGLKTDERIGSRAYLRAGEGFAGGTLARDLNFLVRRAADAERDLTLIQAVLDSNTNHLHWPIKLLDDLDSSGQFHFANARIAVLGLTYKADTNTLRRSTALGFCRELILRGAEVVVFEPSQLSEGALDGLRVERVPTALAAIKGCAATLVMSPEREIQAMSPADFDTTGTSTPLIIDYGRFLSDEFSSHDGVRYVASEFDLQEKRPL